MEEEREMERKSYLGCLIPKEKKRTYVWQPSCELFVAPLQPRVTFHSRRITLNLLVRERETFN